MRGRFISDTGEAPHSKKCSRCGTMLGGEKNVVVRGARISWRARSNSASSACVFCSLSGGVKTPLRGSFAAVQLSGLFQADLEDSCRRTATIAERAASECGRLCVTTQVLTRIAPPFCPTFHLPPSLQDIRNFAMLDMCVPSPALSDMHLLVTFKHVEHAALFC